MDDDKTNQESERKLPIKESLYDKIPITKRQWDIIIFILAIAFVVFFVIGALKGNGLL